MLLYPAVPAADGMADMLNIALYGLLPVAVIGLGVALYRASRDPYRLFHIELNALHDDTVPRTEWLNMGYWEPNSTFPEACKALALKVATAGRCIPGGHVLDCGHGCGDSLLLHLTSDKLPRPATLTGITTVAVQHEHAQRRIKEICPGIPVRLYKGDAVNRESAGHGNSHPFHSPQHLYTSILAIDCAYHFETRELFLRQSFQHITPGGRVALADLVIEPPHTLGLVLRIWLSAVTGIRLANMITSTAYIAMLRQIGYDDIQVQDITEHVFPGFIAFLKQRGGIWRAFTSVPSYWASHGGRFVIVSARRPS